MNNLLRANFSRLRRDAIFWECMLTVLACSVGFMIFWCLEEVKKDPVGDLDKYYFRLSPAMGFFYAVFICLFLSVEYSEGTIRNKLAVGHTRREVYLSNFLTVFTASLCIALAWLAGGLAGVPFLGFLSQGPAGTLLCIAVVIGYTAAFSAIYTYIGMLNDRRTATVIMISVWLLLLLVVNYLESALYEQEFVSDVLIYADGDLISKPRANPRYISGIQREIYQFILDFLPTGQANALYDANPKHPVQMLLSSVFVTVATTLSGLALFQRKDLK